MGILNVTPDSFSDGGQFDDIDIARRHAEHLAEDGAAIIDIGGESTRPGADDISESQELEKPETKVAKTMSVATDENNGNTSNFLFSPRTAALDLNICQLRENFPAMRIPCVSCWLC